MRDLPSMKTSYERDGSPHAYEIAVKCGQEGLSRGKCWIAQVIDVVFSERRILTTRRCPGERSPYLYRLILANRTILKVSTTTPSHIRFCHNLFEDRNGVWWVGEAEDTPSFYRHVYLTINLIKKDMLKTLMVCT